MVTYLSGLDVHRTQLGGVGRESAKDTKMLLMPGRGRFLEATLSANERHPGPPSLVVVQRRP